MKRDARLRDTCYPSPEEAPLPEEYSPKQLSRNEVSPGSKTDPEREPETWTYHLDYFGVAEALISTCRVSREEEAWGSKISITLHSPLQGSALGEAYRRFIDEELHRSVCDYSNMLCRQVPIGHKPERIYLSRQEAEAGHRTLVTYLKMFMCARHLFDDIVAEMEAKRSAFLFDAIHQPVPLLMRDYLRIFQ